MLKDQNWEINLQLLEIIVSPSIPVSKKCLRKRSAPSKIKSLYHLYQLHKNVRKRQWTAVFQGKTKIAKNAKISKRHFSEFVNSSDFMFFGDVIKRPGTTNQYKIHDWLFEAFEFFEKKGMMKNFRENHDLWKEVFLKRLKHWLLPLVRKGHTLNQILMNKISTKTKLKGVDPKTLKGVGIKYTSSSYKAFHESVSNTEQPSLAIQEMCEVDRLLKTRFQIREGDVYMLTKSFSLNHHKRAIRLAESWLKSGMKMDIPIRVYQSCLNKTDNREKR